MKRVVDYCRRFLRRPTAGRIARGTAWTLLGSVLSRGLALASAVFAARLLGKASYGELGIIQSTIGMCAAFAAFGMGTTACRFIAQLRQREPERAGRILGLSSVVSWATGLILTAALVIGAGWIARESLRCPELEPQIRLSAPLVLIAAVGATQTGVLSGFEQFPRIALIGAVSGLLSFPSIYLGARHFGLNGVIGGMLLAQASGCILNFAAIRSAAREAGIRIRIEGLWREIPVLWRFSLPATLGGLVMAPTMWVCSTMLVRSPGGLEGMASYNAANQWFGALLWLPYVLSQALLPIMSERIGAKDLSSSLRLLRASVYANALVVAPVVIGVSLLSPYLMAAYGTGFRSDWIVLVITVASAGIGAVQVPVGNYLAAEGRMWLGFCMNLAWAAVFILATSLLIHHGAAGVAAARLIGYLAQGIWALFYAFHSLQQKAAAGDCPVAAGGGLRSPSGP